MASKQFAPKICENDFLHKFQLFMSVIIVSVASAPSGLERQSNISEWGAVTFDPNGFQGTVGQAEDIVLGSNLGINWELFYSIVVPQMWIIIMIKKLGKNIQGSVSKSISYCNKMTVGFVVIWCKVVAPAWISLTSRLRHNELIFYNFRMKRWFD